MQTDGYTRPPRDSRGQVLAICQLQAHEQVDRKTYRSRDEARADVFDYIGRFYNTRGRHSTLGYMNPMEHEKRATLAYVGVRRTCGIPFIAILQEHQI